jgi:hypothetical protein
MSDRPKSAHLHEDYECLIHPDQGSPERNLLAAMILRAIMDVSLFTEAEDAWAWLLGHGSRNNKGNGGWTFQEACDILDIDAETLLRRIAARCPDPLGRT